MYTGALDKEQAESKYSYETIYGEKITKEAFPITFLEFSKDDKIPKQIEDQRLFLVVASRDVVVIDNYSRDINVGLKERVYFGLGVKFDGDMGTILSSDNLPHSLSFDYIKWTCLNHRAWLLEEGKYLFTELRNKETEKMFDEEYYFLGRIIC